MTRQELWEWLDTCPANWDGNGNRLHGVASPAWIVHIDDFEAVVIGFPVTEDEEDDQ